MTPIQKRPMSKDNSECRFYAYAKAINGVWWAKIFDTETETVCHSMVAYSVYKFGNNEHDALDFACARANVLEEQHKLRSTLAQVRSKIGDLRKKD